MMKLVIFDINVLHINNGDAFETCHTEYTVQQWRRVYDNDAFKRNQHTLYVGSMFVSWQDGAITETTTHYTEDDAAKYWLVSCTD